MCVSFIILIQFSLCCSHSSELEEQAQRAIDTFFSSNVIVPSPWTDSAKRKSFKLPQTPGELCSVILLLNNCMHQVSALYCN